MYIRRFVLNELPSPKQQVKNIKVLTKFYFRPDYDICYFMFEERSSVEYGLMSYFHDYKICMELDYPAFDILSKDSIATLVKTVYITQVETDDVSPITLFEIHQYNNDIRIAEIKFNTYKLAGNFVPPKWFGKEIIDDKFDLKQALDPITLVKEEVAVIMEPNFTSTMIDKFNYIQNERNKRRGGTFDELWLKKKQARHKKL